MRVRLQNLWESLRASYWFIPSLLAALAIALALAGVSLDQSFGEAWLAGRWWVYRGGPEGARTVLSTVAGSIITVAGVVFSITIAVLTLASSQFGPRLLRSFMRDRGNQAVLGTFIATHLYCLLVLRTVRGTDDRSFVPHLSVTGGVVLAIASMGVLIYFIHHVASSIQAPNIIAAVAADLDAAADMVFPEPVGQDPPTEEAGSSGEIPPGFDACAVPVPAPRTGYLCAVDADALLAIAVEHDLRMRLPHRPGHFIVEGRALLFFSTDRGLDDSLCEALRRAFIIGPQRTLTQDVEFAVQQLVELAVRALSPAINDPFSAMACIDRLGGFLFRLSQRKMPSPQRYDRQGQLRVVAPSVTFGGLVEAAFDQIRQNGCRHAAVAVRLLDAIAVIGEGVRRTGDREALLRQIDAIERATRTQVEDERDRRRVSDRARNARSTLGAAERDGAAG